MVELAYEQYELFTNAAVKIQKNKLELYFYDVQFISSMLEMLENATFLHDGLVNLLF